MAPPGRQEDSTSAEHDVQGGRASGSRQQGFVVRSPTWEFRGIRVDAVQGWMARAQQKANRESTARSPRASNLASSQLPCTWGPAVTVEAFPRPRLPPSPVASSRLCP